MTTLTRPHKGPQTQEFGNTQPDGLPHAGTDFGVFFLFTLSVVGFVERKPINRLMT